MDLNSLNGKSGAKVLPGNLIQSDCATTVPLRPIRPSGGRTIDLFISQANALLAAGVVKLTLPRKTGIERLRSNTRPRQKMR